MAQTYQIPLDTNDSLTTTVAATSAALVSLRSSFSGATAPTAPEPVAGQLWMDTADGVLKFTPNGGASALWRSVSNGVTNVDTTTVGNVGSGVDDLISEVVPAGTLAANGQALRIIAAGKFKAGMNNKEVRLLFGATELVSSGVVAVSDGSWMIDAVVVRTGATSQKAVARISCSDPATLPTLSAYTEPGETTGGAITVKLTGEGTANDDIEAEFLLVFALT